MKDIAFLDILRYKTSLQFLANFGVVDHRRHGNCQMVGVVQLPVRTEEEHMIR